MTIISSFEVIGEPIAPAPDVPFCFQGTFIQLTNLDGADASVKVAYKDSSPAFVPKSGNIALNAGYIDGAGALAIEEDFFDNGAVFGWKAIGAGRTIIFGVQYIPDAPAPPGGGPAPAPMMPFLIDRDLDVAKMATTAAIPEPTGFARARGVIDIVADRGGLRLLCTATVRQLFVTFSGGAPTDLDSTAYGLPIINGPVVTV